MLLYTLLLLLFTGLLLFPLVLLLNLLIYLFCKIGYSLVGVREEGFGERILREYEAVEETSPGGKNLSVCNNASAFWKFVCPPLEISQTHLLNWELICRMNITLNVLYVTHPLNGTICHSGS